MTDKSSLVLSGGGHYGIAFHLGFLKGVADAGLNLRQVDYIVGTSAGSQVSATLSLHWTGRQYGRNKLLRKLMK